LIEQVNTAGGRKYQGNLIPHYDVVIVASVITFHPYLDWDGTDVISLLQLENPSVFGTDYLPNFTNDDLA